MMKITLFSLCTILVTINYSLAQSTSGSSSDGSLPQSTGNQLPNFFGFPFPFQIPHFNIPFIRQRRAAEEASAPAQTSDTSNEEQDDHQNRFFFHLFNPSTFVSCNSTTEAGSTCRSCTQALSCGGNNVGRLQRCHGFLPYCNVGRCSFFPGELCGNSVGNTNSTG